MVQGQQCEGFEMAVIVPDQNHIFWSGTMTADTN